MDAAGGRPLLSAPVEPAAARASLTVFFAGTALFAVGSGLVAGIVDQRAGLVALACLVLFLGGWLFRAGGERFYRPAALAAAAKGLADLV